MTEVYICDYIRTPIGRFGGALASVRPDDLARCRCGRCLSATLASIRWRLTR